MVWKAVLWNVVLQTSALLIYIAVGATLPNTWLKAGIKLVFVAGSIFIIFKSFPSYQWKRLLTYSLLAALSGEIVYQTIGYGFFIGLVQGVFLFTDYYFYSTGLAICVAFVFYILCCACSLITRWSVNKWLVKN
jgi:hypothetical protein